ncbi:MAG TPA: gamma carbonic anhydrase family protein [Chthoniobacterales bacterium]|jgi:carbonic anhydrase/acetyltransferase-like protein (isoleucine patch superfamily)|nr:gamma carbonic anhydrase family protein [Chthoniobacterales bacterium]
MELHDVLSRLANYLERQPSIAETAFVAPDARLMGAVTIGQHSSIWYQAVVRADIHSIQIGSRTNIQDGSILHVADQYSLTIGDDVTCGHRAIAHACAIADRVLIGMGAVILDGAEIGSDCIIGAQALVTKGFKVPAGSLVIGSPAKVLRPLTDVEKASISALADKYVKVAAYHRCWLNQQRAKTTGGQKAE